MADQEKMYHMIVENNTNIKHILEEQAEHKIVTANLTDRVIKLEFKDKKTIKEHLVSFGKVCGAFLIIGSATQLLIKIAERLWQ